MGLSDLPTLADSPRRVRQKWEADEHDKTRTERARDQQVATDGAWRVLCQFVTVRDGYRCRCCGRQCNPQATSLLARGHHHHIVYRSALGEDTKENVCLLCADCHDAEHTKKTLHVEGNAEVALTFYKRGTDGHFYVWRQETGIRVYERD